MFHTSGSSGVKSQSLYPEPLYNAKSSDEQRFARNVFDPKSDYVGSHNAFLWKYFDKAAEYKNDEENADDGIYGKTNDKYQQVPDVEQFGKENYYDQGNGNYGKTNDKYRQATDDEQTEKVDHYDQAFDHYGKKNDKYQQAPVDDLFGKADHYNQAYYNYGKTNDKYQQAPDAEQFDKVDHYDQAYDDYQYDRIRSLAHQQNQQTKQNPKNCKIVAIGEMMCSVCKDSAGTHSKSCSTSFLPAKEKYEFTKQRLTAYNSEDDDKKKNGDSEDYLEEY